MNLYLNRPEFFYEMENLCRLFCPYESFRQLGDREPDKEESAYASCRFKADGDALKIRCELKMADQLREITLTAPSDLPPREQEIEMARGLFSLFSQMVGFAPPWGILTGVRPAKLYASLMREKGSERAAQEEMSHRLLVQDDKIRLCARVVDAEQKALRHNSPSAFSLYISIPFCPTRCSYCSFVSHSVEKTAKLVAPYVDLLCRELARVGELANRLGLSLKTIYFGGGTPTQLSALQLDQVMTAVERHFDRSEFLEYTVEGGRPDTITAEKLQTLKSHGVTRLSINPQTMHDRVLQIIGRRHTAQQVIDAYQLARSVGFEAINMDLIAGLPGDTAEGFAESLNQLLSLAPENITVHTLSVKRSARLSTESDERPDEADHNRVAQMLDYAGSALSRAGYAPYYLYRQSKMLGNFENVGWCREGTECLYNIYMMNELHTVLAAGAGAVTRLKEPGGPQIARIFNYKYPYEYIERFDTVLERKKGIGEFYDEYPICPALSTD